MLRKENIENIYTLSPMQEGMFFHALYDKSSFAYFEQISYHLHGDLDMDFVKRSLNELFKRYDILRTVFVRKKADKVLQVVLKEREIDFLYEDIATAADREKYLRDFKEQDKRNSFDLSKDVLMRVGIVKTGAREYEFIWSHHHILMDGWCMGILISEFFEIYSACLGNRPDRLPPVAPYRNYIKWLENQDKEKSKNYWADYLSGYESAAGVPGKRGAGSAAEGFKNEKVTLKLTKEESELLHRLAAKNQVTLNTIIQTAWAFILSKYNRTLDVVFGSVVSGRPPEIDNVDMMVGLFINTVPVRIRIDEEKKFSALLQEVQKEAVESEPHHYYALADIQALSELKQNLLEHIIVFQNYPVADRIEGAAPGNGEEQEGLRLRASNVESFEQTNYDFLVVVNAGERLSIVFDYNGYVYEKELLERVSVYFKRALVQVAENEEINIEDIVLLSDEERKQVLFDFNDTAAGYPGDKTLHRLFEEQVERTPDNIAVHLASTGESSGQSGPDGMRTSLSYGDLDEEAGILASLLIEKGVQPDNIVALMIEKSLEMAVGILGILKSGGAYLPMGPAYPRERKEYILADSAVKILLTTRGLVKDVEEWSNLGVETVFIEAQVKDEFKTKDKTKDKGEAKLKTNVRGSSRAASPPAYRGNPENLAYVIYTSGTTGRPKGVTLEHKGVVNFICWRINEYKFDGSNITLQSFSYTFDGFGSSFYSSLLSAGTLVLVPDAKETDFFYIKNVIKTAGITDTAMVPAMYDALLESDAGSDLNSLKWVTLAGEEANENLINKSKGKYPQLMVYNEFGPTETSIGATFYRDYMVSGSTSVIGKPNSNMQLYILDNSGNPLPPGIPGELVIAGVGVARGYLNSPGLTAGKFVSRSDLHRLNRSYKSVSSNIPGKLYKTGDLACWLPDGNVKFWGRIDTQVKIRGFRIELQEIENSLLKHESIKSAVTLAVENETGNNALCAYIVSSAGKNIPGSPELRRYLSKTLPDYMIPAYFVSIEEIPLTANGKIDRRALPRPGIPAAGEYTAPTGEIETKLALTYSQVLNLEYEKISIDAGFFELGGHSLSAITLVNRMHKELEVKIEVSDIFVFPTIRELAEYIKTKTKERFLSIEKAEKLDYYKTSSAQERLYLLQQMEPDSTVYNMQQVVKLKDEIDSEKLAATFRKLIRRHESLRTSFHLINEEPAQEIHEPEDVEFAIECHELIEAGGKNHESQIIQGKQTAATIFERFIRPFDLSGAPLFRVGLIKIKAETATAISHLLIVDMHHIISDGASQQVLERDFARLYAGETLSPLQLQYRDFSQWQNRQRENDDMLRQAAFWKEEFSGEIPVLNLPTDFPRPAVQGFAGSTLNFEISGADVQGLKKLAGDYNATLYMVLLAAANVFFSRLSSQETIVIGTPTAGRGHADLEPIMGMFVNTLALKNNPQGKKSFSVFLQEVKTRTIKAFENQDYLFEDLVEAVVPRRDTSRNPLFDVMFTLANLDPITSRQVAADGALVSQQTSYKLEVDTAKFDLTFSAFETARKIFFSLEYRTDLFKEAAVKRFISYFKMVISSILKDREQEIGRLEILPDDEKQKVLYEFNDTAVDYPREKTVRELFEEQVERTPDNVAVVQIQDRGGSVAADVLKAGDVLSRGAFTYRELHERSNRLGRLLREKGVKTGTLVSIMVKRSIEMVLGILGILKAGGAFLPVDPQYPPKRIKDMLDDADPGILLTQESLKEKAIFNGECMELDDNSLYRGDCEKLENAGKPGDLIYAMYTSGSTGKSKGVLVEHRNVTRLIMNPDYIELSTKTRILQTGAPVFDATTFEIWGALLNGGQLYLVENEVILDAGRLKSTIKENKITTLWLTAPLFNQLTDQDYRIFSTLEYLLVGGDVLSPRHIEKVRNKYGNLKIINGYGPTENTTFSTTFLIDGEYRENIPIGKPISNSTAFIVDKYDRPQPIGVFGELLVGGDGVSRGYLNSPELTAEKFIERSFKSFTGNFTGHSSPITLYRTGDLARWLPDGNIDFSGRVDYQVKIRGFRIELGEIEIKLRKHEQIKEAVVLARAGDRGDKYLTAYLTAENTAKEVDQGDLSPEPKETGALPDENVPGISVSELREYLGRELPDYMIPSYFVLLDEFSLTENGKIDRKALPAPEGISLSSDADYAAPTGEIEEMLVGIWENVLGIKKIGSKENFFMAGGDSIKAIQVSARMNSAGYKVDMRDIFQYPTIAGLAPHVEKTSRVADQSPVSGEVLLTPIQKKHLQENQPHFHHFNQAVMFYSAADLEEEAVKAIFLKLQQHHDALRMIFTKNSDGTVVQFNREDGDAPLSLQVFDFRRSEKGKELLTREAGKIQASIDLQKGPLMKLGLFRLDDGDRLLVVIHHLVVDGVSWRILFEDITALFRQYGQHGNAGSFELPLKTDSFTNWSEAIRRYADSEKFLKEEKKYWAGLESITVPPLPRDFDGDVHNYVKDTAGLSFALEEAETEKLLTRVNQAFGTEINDILLTALSAAIGSSFGCPRVLVGLEGHGRESISTDIDISRTIGWFTGEFPVILDVSSTAGETGDALGQRIKEVKETLHRVPNNGIGYGILKYLTAAANKEEITFSLNPAVSFNYLGQFDDDVRKMDFQVAAESPGADQSPMLERRFDLDISGSIANKRLRMSVRYNSKNFKVETIETLLENYKEELLRIISYCAGREEKELTPSDMTYDNLSFDSLAALDNLVADIK